MNIRKTLSTLLAAVAFALAFSTSVNAGGHNDYVSVEDCRWYEIFCQDRQRDNMYNTKYPIVLVHGVSGFDKILFVEYFHGIPSDLRSRNADVYIPNVTAWNGIEVRGEQLIDYIQNHVLPSSGASKVNLVGHSMGSPTSRYVASVAPELVASVTSVHGANGGSHFADFMLYQVLPEDHPLYGAYVSFAESLLDAVGTVIDFLATGEVYEQDSYEATYQLATPGSAEFNAQHPQGQPTSDCGSGAQEVNGIHYFSWGGNGGVTNVLDPLDYAMTLIGEVTSDGDTDGLLNRCVQRWGNVLRDDYNHNHTDGSNLLLGMAGLTDPKDIYANHATRLRNMGL